VLPGLAYITSPVDLGIVSDVNYSVPKIVVYVGIALAALWGFHLLALKLEPYLLREAHQQAVFLEGIAGRFLPIAIAGSAALSLFLELAVIRWQGTVFEFFAFYKNYGLLACFAGLGLGYALSRSKEGIPLMLVLPILAWQFILLIALRFGLPTRPYSLEALSRTAQHGLDSNAGPGRSDLFADHGGFLSDGPCVCSGWSTLRETDGTQESTFRLRIESTGQRAGRIADVSGLVFVDAAGGVVWTVRSGVAAIFRANTQNAAAGNGLCHGGAAVAGLAGESAVEQSVFPLSIT
jgi:hypothetical protein